ncbi:MAG: ketopantoate reductase family protein [Armatimonadota bacterium]
MQCKLDSQDSTIPTRNHYRVAIIGPGALGTLFAMRLTLAGLTTVLLDYREDRARLLEKQGLRLITGTGDQLVPVPVSSDPRVLRNFDAALILVKAYHTEEAAATLAEYLPPTAVALTLQNGLGNVETLMMHLGQDRVFGGTTAQGALLEAPGVVRDTGSGPTVIGSLAGTADHRLDALAQALLSAGFAVSMTADLPSALWTKAILNAAINPVAALTRLRNGQLAELEPSLTLMTAVAREASAIARKHGIRLAIRDWRARLQTICQSTAPNINSMLQDVLHQRRTEIDAINGAIIRVAATHRLRATVNRSLWCLITTLEASYKQQLP